jgi:HPt (histidine-containing phosphotransfer) domain-containing protein
LSGRLTGTVLLVLLAAALPVFAIDPLPPEIERASPQVQAAYRDRVGREALRQKLLVGRQRYEQRREFKRTLNDNLRQEAHSRQEAIREQMQPGPVRLLPGDPTGLTNLQLLAAVGILVALGLLLKRLLPKPSPDLVNLGEGIVVDLPLPLGERPAPETPPVDLQVLSNIAGGDSEFLQEIVQLYLQETKHRLDQIRAAIQSGSGPEIKRIARDGAGSSAQCGMTQIAWVFRDLVILGGDHQLQQALLQCQQAEEELTRIQEHLKNLPELSPAPTPTAAPAVTN